MASLTERLIDRVKGSFRPLGDGGDRLCRFEVEAEDVCPLGWLSVQRNDSKIYWSDREGTFEAGGIGCADVLIDDGGYTVAEALAKIEKRLSSCDEGTRYFGSMCFDPRGSGSGQWAGFGRYYFVVPEFELLREAGESSFVFNIVCQSGDSCETIVGKLLRSLGAIVFEDGAVRQVPVGPAVIKTIRRQDQPDKSQWQRNVISAVNDISRKDIEKVVLARKVVFEAAENIDAIELLREVKNGNLATYSFCIQPQAESAFIGCSPECLYKTDGNRIYSEAVAGTCPSGASSQEQQSFRESMRQSPKEQSEHQYVFDDVKAGLECVCDEVKVVSERDILSLSYVQHFRSTFAGCVSGDVHTYDMIEALHPTSAVNGFPRDRALNAIGKYETFSRGCYGGPVGWIERDSAEFAVGIRSGLVEGKSISLFAGAGIVSASEAEMEWDETENKLRQFTDVIGG